MTFRSTMDRAGPRSLSTIQARVLRSALGERPASAAKTSYPLSGAVQEGRNGRKPRVVSGSERVAPLIDPQRTCMVRS